VRRRLKPGAAHRNLGEGKGHRPGRGLRSGRRRRGAHRSRSTHRHGHFSLGRRVAGGSIDVVVPATHLPEQATAGTSTGYGHPQKSPQQHEPWYTKLWLTVQSHSRQ